MDAFDPVKATNTLRDYAVDIDKLGTELLEKRLELIAAQAALYDAEKAARDVQDGINAWINEDWANTKEIIEKAQLSPFKETEYNE